MVRAASNERAICDRVLLRPLAALGLSSRRFAIGAVRAAAADKPDPAADAKAFQKYFTDKFPKLKLEDFVNGPYSMNEDMHKQWEEKEEFPPYEFCARRRQGDVRQAVQERQELCRLLPEWRHRHPAELSLFRREGRQGRHARAGAEPLPRGQWRGAVLLCEGRDGGADRLHGLHLARQAVRHQDPERSARAGGLSRTASAISTRGAASSISPARAAMCRIPASGSAPKCWRPRSGS